LIDEAAAKEHKEKEEAREAELQAEKERQDVIAA